MHGGQTWIKTYHSCVLIAYPCVKLSIYTYPILSKGWNDLRFLSTLYSKTWPQYICFVSMATPGLLEVRQDKW